MTPDTIAGLIITALIIGVAALFYHVGKYER